MNNRKLRFLSAVLLFQACGDVVTKGDVLSAINAQLRADAGEVGVACGAGFCDAGSACCVGAGSGETACAPIEQGCSLNAGSYQCDGPEDCASGLSCCGYSGREGSYCGGASCFAETLCHRSDDCFPELPFCAAGQGGSSYNTCAPRVCDPNEPQTCNDDASVSMLWGYCSASATQPRCFCSEGFEINPQTGKCRPSAP